MEPTKPGGVAKPSKVEAIKLASEYLNTFVAERARQRTRRISPRTRRRSSSSTARISRTTATCGRAWSRGRQGEGLPVHGAGPDRGRQVDGRSVPGLRPPGTDDRQRHPADHHPAGIPAPRGPEGGPEERRSARSTRACSRPWRPAATWSGTCSAARPRSAIRCASDLRPTPSAGPRTAPLGPRATGTSGSTARRSRSLPPRRPGASPHARRRPGRADLRQDLSAPEVQDGLRAARR